MSEYYSNEEINKEMNDTLVFLYSERVILNRFIEQIPEEDVIDLASMKCRLSRVEEQIKELTGGQE